MSRFDIEGGKFVESFTLESPALIITLPMTDSIHQIAGTYVNKDIELTIQADTGVASLSNTSLTANPTVVIDLTAGTVTATTSTEATATPSVTPGWIESGTSGTITISGETVENIPTNTSSNISIIDNTITTERGYYKNNIITTMPAASVTSGSALITTLNVTFDTDSGNFIAIGSGDISAPTIATGDEGYISSSIGTLNDNILGATVNAILPTIDATIEFDSTETIRKPLIVKEALTSLLAVTDASNGIATTVQPASGVYVAVKTLANTFLANTSLTINSAGYGSAYNHNISIDNLEAGAAASDIFYIPIKETNISLQGGTLTNKTATASVSHGITSASNTSGVVITPSASAVRSAIQYATSTEGWITTTINTTLNGWTDSSSSWSGEDIYLTGVILTAETSFNITIPNGENSTITLTFSVDANGNTTIT